MTLPQNGVNCPPLLLIPPPSNLTVNSDDLTVSVSSAASNHHSDSFFSLEDLSIHEDELDADIIQWLRPYGVRFIRDLRIYRHCACTVPPLITREFRRATDPMATDLKDTSDPTPFCFQLVPNRDDFVQDPYGDLFLQDFFVERDARGSTVGILHFAGMFANIEYDRTLREYRVLNLAGNPSLSLTDPTGKQSFKLQLIEFIRVQSSMARLGGDRCPNVSLGARLLVVSYPSASERPPPNDAASTQKETMESVPNEENGSIEKEAMENVPNEENASIENETIRDPNTLINYIVARRKAEQPVEFPSYLLFKPNWLAHTIDEQYANFKSDAGLRSIVTCTEQLKQMTDNEIAAEDDAGEAKAPNVVSYKALLKTRPIQSEPVGQFQRHALVRESGRRQLTAVLRCSDILMKTE